MRLPDSEYTTRPWRIKEIAPDFRLEDVWLLPGTGAADDLARLVDGFATTGPGEDAGGLTGLLFAIRWKLGELLGWDDEKDGLGGRVPTLRDRLPADLRAAPTGPEFQALPFKPLYLLEDEFAAEIANRTVHGVLHLGRVPDGAGGFHVQMAVLVKPNGLFGDAYMLAIKPFRHLIVYPAMMKRIEREIEATGHAPQAAA